MTPALSGRFVTSSSTANSTSVATRHRASGHQSTLSSTSVWFCANSDSSGNTANSSGWSAGPKGAPGPFAPAAVASVVTVAGEYVAIGGVDLDVMTTYVDVEHQVALVVLQVDL